MEFRNRTERFRVSSDMHTGRSSLWVAGTSSTSISISQPPGPQVIDSGWSGPDGLGVVWAFG